MRKLVSIHHILGECSLVSLSLNEQWCGMCSTDLGLISPGRGREGKWLQCVLSFQDGDRSFSSVYLAAKTAGETSKCPLPSLSQILFYFSLDS
jgi:hypothetical protein